MRQDKMVSGGCKAACLSSYTLARPLRTFVGRAISANYECDHRTFDRLDLTCLFIERNMREDRRETVDGLQPHCDGYHGRHSTIADALADVGYRFSLKVAADVPNYGSDPDGSVRARVFAVTRRMDPKLRNGNTLGCGRAQPIRWIVVWRSQHSKALGMDTFSGGQMPQSVKDAGFCGSYFYLPK